MARQRRAPGGFTLIEVMVAIAVMALLAVLSWRGLDGLSKAREQAQQRSDDLLALQAGLAQWAVDLDAVTDRTATPAAGLAATAGSSGTTATTTAATAATTTTTTDRLPTPIDWDGRALRITRRASGSAGEGLHVVAWSRRTLADGQAWWLRWDSGPVVSLGQWKQAWAQAALWAQNPGEAERRREVAVARTDGWQLFYFRNNAWSNPLSSADSQAGATAQGIATGGCSNSLVPMGVRLVLNLSAGQALAGAVTRDWAAPCVTPTS